jgi:hypothetical protein
MIFLTTIPVDFASDRLDAPNKIGRRKGYGVIVAGQAARHQISGRLLSQGAPLKTQCTLTISLYILRRDESQSHTCTLALNGYLLSVGGTRMYTYSQVESALARVHHIPDSSLGSFRGRIKHFQRIGIVPQSSGKGKKISYEKKGCI